MSDLSRLFLLRRAVRVTHQGDGLTFYACQRCSATGAYADSPKQSLLDGIEKQATREPRAPGQIEFGQRERGIVTAESVSMERRPTYAPRFCGSRCFVAICIDRMPSYCCADSNVL